MDLGKIYTRRKEFS